MSESRKLVISIALLFAFCSWIAGAIMFFHADYEGATVAAFVFIVFSVVTYKGLFDKPEGGR